MPFDSLNSIKGNQTPSRGGARKGAGRKKGTLTRRTQEIVAQASADGETPLEYMLRVMRTSDDAKRKDAMAIAAAPFVHPKLAAVEHKGDPDNPVETRSRIEWSVVDPKG